MGGEGEGRYIGRRRMGERGEVRGDILYVCCEEMI